MSPCSPPHTHTGFLHLCSSVMSACNFLFCVAFLLHFSSWWWGLTKWAGDVPPSMFWKPLIRIGTGISPSFGSIHLWSPGLLFVGDFWSQLVVHVIDLFRVGDWWVIYSYLFIFCISSWFSLRILYFSKNLSICCRLSNLLAYSYFQWSLMILSLSVLSVVMSPFSFWIDLSLLLIVLNESG